MVTPSRLVPEIDADATEPSYEEEGRVKYLLGGTLRVIRYENGAVERADERFPQGGVRAIELPERFGGGYLFYQADNQGTRLWRASEWTGRLFPLANTGQMATDVVAGFDRLYLRLEPNRLIAIDPQTGVLMPLGQLPPAPSYGAMAFADGWRAVVDSELRGPMASFDAGATWRTLGITEQVSSASVRDGDPVLNIDGGYYIVDAGGHVQLVRTDDEDKDEPADETEEEEPEHEEHPLGERPLRTAVEHGFPDTPTSAVVAYRGSLVRLSLPDGTVRGVHPHAIGSEQATCHGTRVGTGFGFVCGEASGPTVVYAFAPPLALREVARFDEPRFVSPSGNGALVVRGGCAAKAAPVADMRRYCVIGVDGAMKEIAVRGELGAERVVALGDGRTVVLVPPRLERAGRLTVIDGDKLDNHPLKFPAAPQAAVKLARRGLWLEGFAQRAPDSIGGWVEAGGPIVGITVKLDGSVELGKAQDEVAESLVSGSFALLAKEGGGAVESTDGGKSWSEVELPKLPENAGDPKTRSCSPVGCSLRNWVRVGWGPPAVKDDLAGAALPQALADKRVARPSLRFQCNLVAERDAETDAARAARGRGSDEESSQPRLSAFRGVPAPRLGNDEIGVEKPSDSSAQVPHHLYVWGPKGADWTRAGWWMTRFEDRFDPFGGVRETLRTRPPWADENAAAEAVGPRSRYGYGRWSASTDPSGRAALLSTCAGGRCVQYAVADGRPMVMLREAPGSGGPANRKSLEHSVARLGDTWYFITEQERVEITLWRAELGVMREIGHYRRYERRGAAAAPLLVRRALGAEIGLLFQVPADVFTGNQIGQWVVLPIDAETGALGEPITLGAADLDGKVPARCSEHDDGWLVDSQLATRPIVSVTGGDGFIEDVVLRMRIDPGFVCVDALSARAGRGFRLEGDAKRAVDRERIPMAAREQFSSAKVWQLACRAELTSSAAPQVQQIEPADDGDDE